MTTVAVMRRGDVVATGASGLVFALLAVFAVACWIFANSQDVWIDEATQLSGITLTIPEMLRWLAGEKNTQFGVPADRTPPVSYLVDWLWLRLSGPSEVGFRLLHALITTAGLWIVARATHARFGNWGTAVCLLFLVLSPNLLQLAVEVRAYPIFFAVTCVQLSLFLRVNAMPGPLQPRVLVALGVASLLAVYTHFFGLVSTCSFFLALGLANIRQPRALVQVMAAGGLTLALGIGVLPFALAAAGISSGTEATAGGATEYATYFLRLIATPVHLIWPWAGAVYILVVTVLLAASAHAAVKRAMSRSVQVTDWLWVVLGAGIAATVAASFIAKGFNALRPSYSAWLIPVIAVLMASGIAEVGRLARRDRLARVVIVGTLVFGGGASVIQMLVHAPLFVHGPRRVILGELREPAGSAAILYEAGTAWDYAQIPVHFTTRGDVPQFTSRGATGVDRPVIGAPEGTLQPLEAVVSPYSTLLVVHVKTRRHQELKACLHGMCPDMPRFEAAERLISSGRWKESTRRRSFGMYDVEIHKLIKVVHAGPP